MEEPEEAEEAVAIQVEQEVGMILILETVAEEGPTIQERTKITKPV
jgi:hypothetical protein